MEVDNRYKMCLLIILITCLDVAVGKLTFEAVINNVRRQDLTRLQEFKDLEMGDNMTLFCNDSGKPGRLLHYNTELSSPFTLHVQPCRDLGHYDCQASNQDTSRGITEHSITLHSQCRVSFKAVVNNEKPVNLTDMSVYKYLKKGDNLTLLCHVDGVPAQLVRLGIFPDSHFPMQVNRCGFFAWFACIPRDAIYRLGYTRQVLFESKCALLTFDLSPIPAREGDNVKVVCRAESSGQTHIRIIKEDTGRVIPSSPHYNDTGIEEVTSELEHLTCDDIGTYTCLVVNRYGDVNNEKTAELQIHECPTMFMKIDVSRVASTKIHLAGTKAYIGDNARLTCRTEDYPTSLITIIREDTGTVLSSSQSNTGQGHAEVTFDLRDITCDGMTSYICQATGQDGKVHNRTAELPVDGCPPKLCRNETVDVVVDVTESTTVKVCLRASTGTARVGSFYRGVMKFIDIPGEDQIDIEFTKDSGIYRTLIIHFKNIQEHDYGKWLFPVRNQYGELNVTINLRPAEETNVHSVTENNYDVVTDKRGNSGEKIDDHSGVSTKMTGMGTGLAISVTENNYNVNTDTSGHSGEKKDDHSGVSTKLIGTVAGLAISGLVIILLSLIIITR